jgi:predicted dehydrogenase
MNSRRDFLATAGATLAASQWSRVLGANDRVNVAIVGLGGRGMDHLRQYAAIPGARISALCDVNQASVERAQAQAEKLTGEKPKGYENMKDVFADKNVDAVSMPLPNHWHALATIWAVQAGKDVYIEKPASHNIWEGLQMVKAARKYNRMVQIGSQSRSIPHKVKAMQLLKDGIIGPVYASKGLCYKRRKSIGRLPDLDQPPPGVNWDLFLGPAPMRKFNELRFKYNWHWFWDTGNGDIGNQGVHEMDIARWGMELTWPTSVFSSGGKLLYDDMQETPNTQHAVLTYPNQRQIEFEVRGLITGDEGGLKRRGTNTIGDLFFGADGWMSIDGDGFTVFKGESAEVAMQEKKSGVDTRDHMANFLAACRSRKHTDLAADVEVGVISAGLCHLANISYRLGRKLDFDPHKVQFVNDAEANRMLTREYRQPYAVPANV